MSQILVKLHAVDPNNSEAVKEVLTSFFQHLTKCNDIERNTWLQALEKVICRFPKYCSSHRQNVEEYLCQYLDADNYFQVIKAAKCIHALQQVRPFQDRTATAKSCWRDQMNYLCKAAHSLISAIFTNVVDIYKEGDEVKESFSNSPFSNALRTIKKVPNNKHRKKLLTLRLRNILVFIQAMLVEIYPVAKSVDPQHILDLLLRTQSVSSVIKMNEEIQDIKIQSLRTLDALIACLDSHLLPYSPLVIRFLMQTLKWSSENPGEEASKVRISTYNGLKLWLETLRSHRAPADSTAWQEHLTSHVIDDITPEKKSVELTIGSQPMRKLSKKAQRKQTNAMLRESSIAVHMPGEKNKPQIDDAVINEVALSALNCAEVFLVVCGRFLNPTTHKIYQERLVRECFNSDHSDEHLLVLLRTLEACRKSVPSGLPPPTQYCLHLYSILQSRPSPEISQLCTHGLLDIRLHLHYSPPSLTFNLEAPQSDQVDLNRKKKISKINRAALEAKLDDICHIEDTTISDEPSSKKPRLEVTSEQISIEQTGTSIIISDCSDDEVQEVSVTALVPDGLTTEEQTSIETTINGTSPSNECVENSINDAITQVPILSEASSNDTTDRGETPVPMVVEEANCHNTNHLPLVDKNDSVDGVNKPAPCTKEIDDNIDNLPCSNESDDVQITCGQEVRCSQEANPDTKSEGTKKQDEVIEINSFEPKQLVENGINNENTEDLQNGTDHDSDIVLIRNKNIGISVDDMLADFVDEVNVETVTD